jgi:hypothetical protein
MGKKYPNDEDPKLPPEAEARARQFARDDLDLARQLSADRLLEPAPKAEKPDPAPATKAPKPIVDRKLLMLEDDDELSLKERIRAFVQRALEKADSGEVQR